MEGLKHLNAINAIIESNLDELFSIHNKFEGDWERAWFSLYKNHKNAQDPNKLWSEHQKHGIDMITIFDKDYPQRLQHIPHSPFVLYVRGNRDALNSSGIAVVGTRRVTPYGKRVVPDIVGPISSAGLTIYSGLAYGVDALAHRTTLDAGGTTVAVLANGLDDRSIMPRANFVLAKEIVDSNGALVCEYAPGFTPYRASFPQRNRIMSGLSLGVLVIEGDIKSGTMVTARCAIDQNRDIFAIPGTIYSKRSEGTNWLIKKAAKLVTCADDVLEEYDLKLQITNNNSQVVGDNEEEKKILELLTSGPLTIDDIIRQTGLDVAIVNSTLMIMELNNKVSDLGDGKYGL